MNKNTQNAVVRARINENIKNEASKILAETGLTISDAFRILLTKIAVEKVFPLELMSPNKESRQAIKELENGGGEHFNTVDEMLAKI